MNFLAHYLLATKYLAPIDLFSCYIVGNALPDLLPLASARLRPAALHVPLHPTQQDNAFRQGAMAHFASDAAFHKLDGFRIIQEHLGELIAESGFVAIRVRKFFLAHILAELALDSILLRDDPQIADKFYAAFNASEINAAVRWAEAMLQREIPALPMVLARFARSRYLEGYRDDAGVAVSINRLCARARQDTFEGANEERLLNLVNRSLPTIDASALMTATAEAVRQSYPATILK